MRKFYILLYGFFLIPTFLLAQIHTAQELAEIEAANSVQTQFGLQNTNSPISLGVYSPDNVMEIFIPTAGQTETFEPAVGDFFYDTGGPGGSAYPDYDNPGDYMSCTCLTSTTLSGVTELKFHSLGIFSTFDYLKIYDGSDNSGTLLYNNGSGGVNVGDLTLVDMIASHGSDTFIGTSGSFYFEFYATGTVAYSGWEVEIISSDNGSGGNSDAKIAVIQDPYVLLLNAETGEIENPQFIDLTSVNPTTPKGIRQIGEEIWITDQLDDMIYRYDLEGNFLSSITGNMDNIKGLDLVNNSEVWVTNYGSGNNAPGLAIVRLDTDGNVLGNFATGRDPFDILDNGSGEVYISYISDGSPIERRDYDGNFLDYIVDPGVVNFAEQMFVTQSGDLLVTTFSSASGIYIFDIETGEQLNYWSQSGARGTIETGDGHILWTNSNGIHKMDPNTGTSTLLSAGSAQFFTLLNAEDNNGGNDDCSAPTLSVEDPDAICEGTTATLIANSNGEQIHWYDSESATAPIFTGSEFTTPELSETTTYWVQAVNHSTGDGEIIEGGARLAPASNSNSDVVDATSPWGLSFDTTADFTITSVDVYLADSNPGEIVMQLLDENWEVLDETTVSVPAGNSSNPVQFEVPLNFFVEAGNTYRLVAASSPILVREFSDEHPGFPYPIGDGGTVTGGTINNGNTNTTVYYFFYNWTVATGEVSTCESDLVEVTVTVNPAPDAPTIVDAVVFEDGDTLADLEDALDFEGDLTWYADEELTIVLPETELVQQNTTYWVTQNVNGCESEALIVNPELLAMSEFNNEQFSVYPNPVKDFLTISGKNEIQSVEIFDLTGKKLSTIEHLIQNQIDFSQFNSGVYLMKIHSGKSVDNIKVIKK